MIGGFSISCNSFTNDPGNGVLIEGEDTINNVVQYTEIGRTKATEQFYSRKFAGVGRSGIAIINGAHDNIIGSRDVDMRVHIDACPEAGILIDGTDHNLVQGCFLGYPNEAIEYAENEKNRIGIHIRNGAKGNQIGRSGPMLGHDPNYFIYSGIVHRMNKIANSREAGIWIENAGGSLDQEGNRVDPNVLHNNYIAGNDGYTLTTMLGNDVGLKISGNSRVNDIGGRQVGNFALIHCDPTIFVSERDLFTGEDNYIQGTFAGVQIKDVTIRNPEERNRFLNNVISSSEAGYTDSPVDLQAGPPRGVGVLINGLATGNVLGESSMAPNQFGRNLVAVYIDNAHANVMRGNKFHMSNAPKALSGVVIKNGWENRIGRDISHEGNTFRTYRFQGATPPTTNPDAGAILVLGGRYNSIQNNRIQNASGQGILLVNTTSNMVGSPKGQGGNYITESEYNGVRIRGNDCTNNFIRNNQLIQNWVNGVEVSEGASQNLIGGKGAWTVGNNTFLLPAPNVIRSHIGHGVKVSGAGTTGNSILYNSIYNNAGLGISNENFGNDELPPPENVSYGVGSVKGEVSDVDVVPPGSVINVFSDTADEGQVFLAKTTVRDDGTWSVDALPPIPFKNLTATVTHASTGSTSEFALALADRSFNIVRADGQAPGEKMITFTENHIPVLVLEATAAGEDVRVYNLKLDAQGTLLDDTQINGVRIYMDNDLNGQITEADSLMAGPFTFDSDDGQANVALPGVLVEPDIPQQWIIAYEISRPAQEGATFSIRISSALYVKAEFVLSPIPMAAIPTGPFPVSSDLFTVENP